MIESLLHDVVLEGITNRMHLDTEVCVKVCVDVDTGGWWWWWQRHSG